MTWCLTVASSLLHSRAGSGVVAVLHLFVLRLGVIKSRLHRRSQTVSRNCTQCLAHAAVAGGSESQSKVQATQHNIQTVEALTITSAHTLPAQPLYLWQIRVLSLRLQLGPPHQTQPSTIPRLQPLKQLLLVKLLASHIHPPLLNPPRRAKHAHPPSTSVSSLTSFQSRGKQLMGQLRQVTQSDSKTPQVHSNTLQIRL